MGTWIRRNALILATVSFVAMVTGVSLQLHLLSQDHSGAHDFDHCSICQQLLTAPGKFIREPESRLPETDLFENDAVFPLHVHVIAFHHNPFGPRSPPFV